MKKSAKTAKKSEKKLYEKEIVNAKSKTVLLTLQMTEERGRKEKRIKVKRRSGCTKRPNQGTNNLISIEFYNTIFVFIYVQLKRKLNDEKPRKNNSRWNKPEKCCGIAKAETNNYIVYFCLFSLNYNSYREEKKVKLKRRKIARFFLFLALCASNYK